MLRSRRVVASSAIAAGASYAALIGPGQDVPLDELTAELPPSAASPQEVAQAGASAATILAAHGAVVLHKVLRTELWEGREQVAGWSVHDFDMEAAGRACGQLAATLLPTVHQADAWRNLQLGALLGQRAAAAAFGSAPEPTLLGCLQAVAKLEPHAHASWRPSLLLPPGRAIELQPASHTSLDEGGGVPEPLQALLPPRAPELGNALDGATPQASLLRSWAAVLLAPAGRWASALDSACHIRQQRLTQCRTRLILPPAAGATPSSTEAAAAGDTVARPPAEPSELEPKPERSSPEGSGRSPLQVAASFTASIARQVLWPRATAPGGVCVLLPLPPATLTLPPAEEGGGASGDPPHQGPGASVIVDVLLPPADSRPSVRLALPPGSALILDGRARWRLVGDEHGGHGRGPCACVIFEYDVEGASAPPAQEALVTWLDVVRRGAHSARNGVTAALVGRSA